MTTLLPTQYASAVDLATADEQLCHRIRMFLERLRLAILKRIQIDVQSGVVTIEGIARSYYERQMAVACVKRVAGVRQVNDRIVVHESPT